MKCDVVLYSAAGADTSSVQAQAAACIKALGRHTVLSSVILTPPLEMTDTMAARSGLREMNIVRIDAKRSHNMASLCNMAADKGNAPWILFLDIRRKPDTDFWDEIEQALALHPEAGAFTCRLLPSDNGYYIDPVTLEAYFLQPEAMLVGRRVFDELKGFDTWLPADAAAEDFSLRLRAEGCKMYYAPFAVLLETAPSTQEALREQYVNGLLGDLLLAYKCGGASRQRRQYRKQIKTPRHFVDIRKLLLANYLRHFLLLWPCWIWRFAHRSEFRATRGLRAATPACALGPDVSVGHHTQGVKISVVVRTHARPHRLRDTLLSVANQTYQNYEVVVVEDGEATARAMVENEFGHLPIRYMATNTPVGRSRAGNLGMKKASGEYICLLDDDDYFYPEHLELYAAQAAKYPNADILLGFSTAMLADVESESPYRLAIKSLRPITYDRLDVFTMSQSCQIHISGAVFKRNLFLKCGGLDEKLEAHEDWAMWLRYLAVAKRAHPQQADIARATTVFVQPASQQAARARMREYMKSDAAFFADESIHFTVTLAQMRSFYDGVLADVQHVKNLGELDDFLQSQANRDAIRD